MTVQEAVPGAVQLTGVQLRFESTTTGVRFSANVLVTAPRVAVIVTVRFELAADGALAVKLTAVAPFETTAEAGTVTLALLLESPTLVLPCAAPLSVTVQDVVPGAVRVPGVHVRLESTGAGGVKVTEKVLVTAPRVAVIRKNKMNSARTIEC